MQVYPVTYGLIEHLRELHKLELALSTFDLETNYTFRGTFHPETELALRQISKDVENLLVKLQSYRLLVKDKHSDDLNRIG